MEMCRGLANFWYEREHFTISGNNNNAKKKYGS